MFMFTNYCTPFRKKILRQFFRKANRYTYFIYFNIIFELSNENNDK